MNVNTWNLFLILYRNVNNMLTHAFIHKNNNRQIMISLTESSDQTLRLSVKDNGSGIPLSIMKTLQTSFEKKQCQGSLTHMKLWVEESLNGTFSLLSEAGMGTELICILPLDYPSELNSV